MPDTNLPETKPQQAVDATPPAPAAGRGRRRMPWIIVAVMIVVTAGGAAWWVFRPVPQLAQARPPMEVPVMTVVAHTVPIYRSFPATTQAMRTVTIQARVTGYLVQQIAVDGADVASGALLYRIDDKDYKAAFAEAEATLAQVKASLDYSRVSQGRNQTLAYQGWVSQDTSDQANSTFHQGQASVANSDAALRQAALNLSRTEIRAPFAGRLSASQVFEGSLISVAGATLNTLVQLDPIYVSFNPAEVNLDQIMREQAHAPVEAAISVKSGDPSHRGAVTFIDNQVSLSTGTILVRATIANSDNVLVPGQYVTARLHLGDLNEALLVPQSAVGSTQIGRIVMIVASGNKVEQRLVTLGDNEDDMVVVTKGLQAGDRVITGQLQKLRQGELIEPAEEQDPKTAE
jgi:multidrug efflux system membrane fusion protein